MNRWLLPASTALLLLSTISGVVAAAEPPMLGGRLSPTNLVYERDQAVHVTNLSNVPVTLTLAATGDGWAMPTDPVLLQPDERRTIPIVTAGEADATIRATLTPILEETGVETASLILVTNARHLSPWESIPPVLWLLALVSALVGAGAVLRRRTR